MPSRASAPRNTPAVAGGSKPVGSSLDQTNPTLIRGSLMAQTQISDVVVPAEFTAYQVENSMVSTALFQSGVVLPNGEMSAQLQAGAQQFTVPFWSDIPDIEADITTDVLASAISSMG